MKISVYSTKHQIQGKSNFNCNIKFKVKLHMLLKNKKNILHNIKFKLKLLVFIQKLQKTFLRKGGLAHYVSLGDPGPRGFKDSVNIPESCDLQSQFDLLNITFLPFSDIMPIYTF